MEMNKYAGMLDDEEDGTEDCMYEANRAEQLRIDSGDNF